MSEKMMRILAMSSRAQFEQISTNTDDIERLVDG